MGGCAEHFSMHIIEDESFNLDSCLDLFNETPLLA